MTVHSMAIELFRLNTDDLLKGDLLERVAEGTEIVDTGVNLPSNLARCAEWKLSDSLSSTLTESLSS